MQSTLKLALFSMGASAVLLSEAHAQTQDNTISQTQVQTQPQRSPDAAGAGPAAVQQGGTSNGGTGQTANSGSSVAEVIVTAQKRSQNIQRVPAAVSVVSNARLTALGVTNLDQLGNTTPGVEIVPLRNQSLVFIRGVGQTLTSPNADAAVATNLNGVYLPAEIAGASFFDVDRVELVPGPQGTLYGRNSTGGVVNITTRTPNNSFGADGFVELGNYDRRQVVLGLDVPITSALSSRTAGTIVDHDGYFTNGEDDEKASAVRETLVWKPSTRTSVTGVATYTHDGGIGDVLQNVPELECGDRCATFNPRALGYYHRDDVFQGSLQVNQELTDALSLTYIGGYNHVTDHEDNALYVGPPPAPYMIREKIGIQSDEFRLNANFRSLQGIAGLYYFNQNTFFETRAQTSPAFIIDNPFSGPSHGEAAFAQGTYSVLPALRLTVGGRYSETVKSIDGFNSNTATSGALLLLRPYDGRSVYDHPDWKVGAEYDLTPRSLLYANVSTGFTPGGFSTAPAVVGQTQAAPFKPVTLLAYTAGTKNRFSQGRITVNLEGFYYDYKNYQVSARDVVTAQNLVFNAAKATIYGAQLDSHFTPTRFDDFSVGATYLHAIANVLVTPTADYNGYQLPFSPDWTLNAFYQRSIDVGNDAQVRAKANFQYTTGRWSIYSHAPGFYINADTHTDLTLGYYAAGDRWYLQGFVRNVENNVVKTTCSNALPGPAGCYFEPPRTYGATLGFKY